MTYVTKLLTDLIASRDISTVFTNVNYVTRIFVYYKTSKHTLTVFIKDLSLIHI